MASALSADAVREALREVVDPEIGINIVDLGLIYDVAIEPADGPEGGDEPEASSEPEAGTDNAAQPATDRRMVTVTMTLTTPGCPAGPTILQEVKDQVEAMEGVGKGEIDLTFSPMWNEEMMSEDVRWILGR